MFPLSTNETTSENITRAYSNGKLDSALTTDGNLYLKAKATTL